MAGVTLDNGVVYAQQAILTRLTAVHLFLGLFKADLVPSINDASSTYTAAGQEADFPGYGRIELNDWNGVALAAHVAANVETLRIFTASGPSTNDIYGYFLCNSTGVVMFAERDPNAPINMRTAGASYAIVPRIFDKNP